jgi:hypothetical protein
LIEQFAEQTDEIVSVQANLRSKLSEQSERPELKSSNLRGEARRVVRSLIEQFAEQTDEIVSVKANLRSKLSAHSAAGAKIFLKLAAKLDALFDL